MKQEDKKLLLKDLCCRLPYGVIIKHKDEHGKSIDSRLVGYNGDWFNYYIDDLCFHLKIHEFKPYLRPISSMTEEKTKIYHSLQDTANSYHYEFGDIVDDFLYFDNDVSLDYLNSIHIDYRGLIEKGLALEAPEGMYNLKD